MYLAHLHVFFSRIVSVSGCLIWFIEFPPCTLLGPSGSDGSDDQMELAESQDTFDLVGTRKKKLTGMQGSLNSIYHA